MNKTKVVVKKGHSDWNDLIGETFEFLFYPGWEEPEWIEITLESVLLTENEFGTPFYYLWDAEGGGYGFYESDEVKVIVHD